MLPPATEEFVPPGRLAHFVRELVREELDLSGILAVYDDERGQPPYHPVMMTALLLYAYCQGVYASRRIAQRRLPAHVRQRVPANTGPPMSSTGTLRRSRLMAAIGPSEPALLTCLPARVREAADDGHGAP